MGPSAFSEIIDSFCWEMNALPSASWKNVTQKMNESSDNAKTLLMSFSVKDQAQLFAVACILLVGHVFLLHINQCLGVKTQVLRFLSEGSHHRFGQFGLSCQNP
jgi:hypothetical protein